MRCNLSVAEFEEVQRFNASARRSMAIIDMTEAEIKQMTTGRMDPAHDHLNSLLDQE